MALWAAVSAAAAHAAVIIAHQADADALDPNSATVTSVNMFNIAEAVSVKSSSLTVLNSIVVGLNSLGDGGGKTSALTIEADTLKISGGGGEFAAVQSQALMDSNASSVITIGAKDRPAGTVDIQSEADYGIYTRENERSDTTASRVQIYARELIIQAQDSAVRLSTNSNGGVFLGAKDSPIHTAVLRSSNYEPVYATEGNLEICADALYIERLGGGGAVFAQNSSVTIDAAQKLVIQGGITALSNNFALDDAERSISINSGNDSGLVQITGDITTTDNAGNDKMGVEITLGAPGSYFNGSVDDKTAQTTLNLNPGTAWVATEDSNVANLNMNGGAVDVSSSGADVTVTNTLKGDGRLIVDANKEGALKESGDDLDHSGASVTVSPVQTADELTDDQVKELAKRVGIDGVDTKVAVAEGMYKGSVSMAGDGVVVRQAVSTLMDDVLTLATGTTFSLNRTMMNDVRRRMGDLRSYEGMSGAWVRWDGGRLSGNGVKNTFNTVQLGYDTVANSSGIRFGLAANYTNGDADYRRGSSDMDAYGFAVYGSWMGKSGLFADVIARFGKAENDMTVDGKLLGTLDNMALSLSGEFGYRYQVSDRFFIEPQAELTYTYVNADTLRLGSAVYDFDSADSLIGRIGAVFGYQLPDSKGSVYARVSGVHEFLGDTAVTGGSGLRLERDGEDSWVEFGVGANFKLNSATNIWFDVERTEGAELDEDWRATAGVRWSF